MARKTPQGVTKSWPRQQGTTEAIERNTDVEVAPLPGAVRQSGEVVFDEHFFNPSALREMLKLNEYQVVLVSPNRQDRLGGSGLELFAKTPPTVLLPFSWSDLVAGVSELVRDSNRPADDAISQFADFCVDFIKMEVRRLSGEVINLSKQEFKILKCFMSNSGRVLSRDELLKEAWGYECYPSTRTVDNHICRLRRKFEIDPNRPIHFRTVHGVGYKFEP
jgi:DNA-binding response OmpR family regulator